MLNFKRKNSDKNKNSKTARHHALKENLKKTHTQLIADFNDFQNKNAVFEQVVFDFLDYKKIARDELTEVINIKDLANFEVFKQRCKENEKKYHSIITINDFDRCVTYLKDIRSPLTHSGLNQLLDNVLNLQKNNAKLLSIVVAAKNAYHQFIATHSIREQSLDDLKKEILALIADKKLGNITPAITKDLIIIEQFLTQTYLDTGQQLTLKDKKNVDLQVSQFTVDESKRTHPDLKDIIDLLSCYKYYEIEKTRQLGNSDKLATLINLYNGTETASPRNLFAATHELTPNYVQKCLIKFDEMSKEINTYKLVQKYPAEPKKSEKDPRKSPHSLRHHKKNEHENSKRQKNKSHHHSSQIFSKTKENYSNSSSNDSQSATASIPTPEIHITPPNTTELVTTALTSTQQQPQSPKVIMRTVPLHANLPVAEPPSPIFNKKRLADSVQLRRQNQSHSEDQISLDINSLNLSPTKLDAKIVNKKSHSSNSQGFFKEGGKAYPQTYRGAQQYAQDHGGKFPVVSNEKKTLTT